MRKKGRVTNISHIAEAATVLWLALQSPGNFYYWKKQCLTWPLWTPCRFHQFYPTGVCIHRHQPPESLPPLPLHLHPCWDLYWPPAQASATAWVQEASLDSCGWPSPLCVDLGLCTCMLLAWLLSLASTAVYLPVLRSWCHGNLRWQPIPPQMPVGLDLAPSLVIDLYHWADLQLAPSAAHQLAPSAGLIPCTASTARHAPVRRPCRYRSAHLQQDLPASSVAELDPAPTSLITCWLTPLCRYLKLASVTTQPSATNHNSRCDVNHQLQTTLMPAKIPFHWTWTCCWGPQQPLQPLWIPYSATKNHPVVDTVAPSSLHQWDITTPKTWSHHTPPPLDPGLQHIPICPTFKWRFFLTKVSP